jgi:TetR/AcrR family transcriptional regulator, transcriptional repressor for nem operon
MRKGEATRREIIQKAAPIFNQKGFEGASLSELMRATGLEKGGIYRHFKSKEQLAGEAFDFAWKTAVELRLADTEEIENSVDRLKQVVRNFLERREGLVPGGCPLLNTAIDSDDGNPVLRSKAKRAMKEWLDRIGRTIVRGQERGEIKRDVDAMELSTLIVSTLEGSLMLRRLQRKDEPLALACRHIEEYLEEKVRA